MSQEVKKPEKAVEPASKTHPEFYGTIQKLLNELTTNEIVDLFQNWIEYSPSIVPEKSALHFVDSLSLLGKTAPQTVIDFLFGVLDEDYSPKLTDDSTKVLAAQALDVIITRKEDESLLIRQLAIILFNSIDDENLEAFAEIIKNRTK